jgi:hypothetical protein
MDDHVQEHGPTPVNNRTDSAFSDAFLMMCASTRKGKGLTASSKVSTKIFRTKRDIISVVPKYFNIEGTAVLFTRTLGPNSIPATKGHLMLEVHKFNTVINEESSTNVAIFLLFLTFCMRKSTRYSTNVLIFGNHRSWVNIVSAKNHIIFRKMSAMIYWRIPSSLFCHLAGSTKRQ